MGSDRIYVHYRVFPEDKLWVGECMELGISTSAETQDEVKKGIEEATQLYVDTLVEQGELSRVLRERGILIFAEGDMPREEVERRSVSVPAGAR